MGVKEKVIKIFEGWAGIHRRSQGGHPDSTIETDGDRTKIFHGVSGEQRRLHHGPADVVSSRSGNTTRVYEGSLGERRMREGSVPDRIIVKDKESRETKIYEGYLSEHNQRHGLPADRVIREDGDRTEIFDGERQQNPSMTFIRNGSETQVFERGYTQPVARIVQEDGETKVFKGNSRTPDIVVEGTNLCATTILEMIREEEEAEEEPEPDFG